MDRRREEGAVAIEFAIVALLFFALLFGIVAFGAQFGARIAAVQAASEGARAAVAGLDAAERRALASARARAVADRYGTFLPAGSATVAVNTTDPTQVAVTVTIDVSRFAVPSFGGILPALPRQAAATSSVRVGGF